MKPTFQPQLVNDPFGDPALYVEFLFQKRALLFDLGDIHALSPRKLLRLSHVFVSHAHMDHFYGFDYLLRVCLGRAMTLRLYGPAGFIDRVEHRLGGYTWNLVENYADELVFIAHEWEGGTTMARARFRCRRAFARENLSAVPVEDRTLAAEPGLKVRAAVLDHKIPCLAFCLEETEHVNIWKNRLEELGVPTGPWLQELKQAVLAGKPDDLIITARWRDGTIPRERRFTLGELKRKILRIVPGLRVGYVVDCRYDPQNLKNLQAILSGVDRLYIEAAFSQEEAEMAREKYHLTAWQAGDIARRVGAKRLVPFHFSARHQQNPDLLYRQAAEGFGRPLS
ncbi:ribonuclease Z [Methylomarinovum caldicuralii]|uniref:Ribonuclease Z n=1 Tax=Methylomarinovum caldicuralii TaxID=438856 RepID=A0AAU9CNS9_9GAMM|nr:MBL fold metallo-hydrolase [Methylomarinovum caldicuralii]BCX81177.1 ribonuclease Z [Methylomarinovum caldicuralii]